MAIGIRILSNNLSGKTANVTFLPTSGGTLDLGSKTIPFNYLTSDPYGVYEVYVPEYDYTYELTASASVFTGQSYTFVSKLLTNNNNAAATLNFNDFTSEIIDLEVDYTGWYCNDVYPLTNSGYAYYFQNNNTCDLQWVIFTDVFGNILESFQTNCNCDYSYDVLGGKWAVFTDEYNRILKYSNGKDVYTLTADTSYQNIFYYSDWDGVMSNDKFIVGIENYTANTLTNYIVNGATLTQFGSQIDINTYNCDNEAYFGGDFIVRIINNYNINLYSFFDIYDGNDGSLLETLDLRTGDEYNDYRFQFYGDNKFCILFWNYGDDNVDYLIMHYDGNTRTLKTTTHPRLNYTNYPYLSSNTNFFPNNGGSESFVLTLSFTNGYDGFGDTVSYCDLIYMLSGDTDFRTYTFQNSGSPDKSISLYFRTSNSLSTICNNGDGYVSTLTLVPSGATYNSTSVLISDGGYAEFGEGVGNGFVSGLYTNNSHDQFTLTHILEDGSLGDIINSIPLNGQYQLRYNNVSELFQFTNYNTLTYYLDGTTDTFKTDNTLSITGNTINTYEPERQFKSDFLKTGPILTFDYNTMVVNLLTSTGYTSTHVLPSHNGNWNFQVGSDKFMYTFLDLSGYTNINLYDFDFNLLNSEVTPYTSWWTANACGDRFVVIINENNEYTIYLVSESTITSSSLTDDNSYDTMNDYVWWD